MYVWPWPYNFFLLPAKCDGHYINLFMHKHFQYRLSLFNHICRSFELHLNYLIFCLQYNHINTQILQYFAYLLISTRIGVCQAVSPVLLISEDHYICNYRYFKSKILNLTCMNGQWNFKKHVDLYGCLLSEDHWCSHNKGLIFSTSNLIIMAEEVHHWSHQTLCWFICYWSLISGIKSNVVLYTLCIYIYMCVCVCVCVL